MLFAALCFIGASAAMAAGPKGPRPAKVNLHAQRGAGAVNKGPRTPRAGDHAGKPKDVPRGTAGRDDRGRDNADRARRDNDRGARDETIAARISRNPEQEARLKAMLPSGMTLEQASSGFRNQGQFIAALEASKNQNIPFAKLKAEMTGEHPLSLGQAIQKLKPADQRSDAR
jgi:hypothetical protein